MIERKTELAQNLKLYHSKVDTQAILMAVSKNFPASDIELCYELGQRHFGENRVQELQEKALTLSHLAELKWHFIGHLQTNKVNQLLKIPNLVCIHSIDRLELLERLLASTVIPSQKLGLFLQVNTSFEDEKSGFETFEQLKAAVDYIDQKFNSKHYFLQGLMTIGSIRAEDFKAAAINSFQKLIQMRDQLVKTTNFKHLELSMGMSADLDQALEYKTDWVRVGTAIFGQRKP